MLSISSVRVFAEKLYPLDMLDNSLEHVRYTNLSSDPAPRRSIISSACSQPEINLWQGRNIFLGDKGDLRLRDNSSLSIDNGLQSTWALTIETFSLKRHGQTESCYLTISLKLMSFGMYAMFGQSVFRLGGLTILLEYLYCRKMFLSLISVFSLW